MSLSVPRLARVVRRCQELPGQELFCYVASDRSIRHVGSGDVNDYIREITGDDFTAKDFRTWGGTVLALGILRSLGECHGNKAKSAVVECFRRVSRQLGNTPAVCKKYYVHPAVIQAFLTGTMFAPEVEARGAVRCKTLRPDEAALSQLLAPRGI